MTWWWRNFFFSFLLGRFSENLRRKWTSEIVNVIVKRQLDSNFHGLYSYRPKKWRKNVQNFAVKPLACGYIVVLLEFWTYWRHSMVDKSTAHGKIVVVDFSSRFWYVQHYMAGKPNQSCHKFVEYVLKGWKKKTFFWVVAAVQPSFLPSISRAFLIGTLIGNPRFSTGSRMLHYVFEIKQTS